MVGRSFSLKKAKSGVSGMSNASLLSLIENIDMRSGWMSVFAVFVAGFSIMGYTGFEIYRQAPPIPTFTFAADGKDKVLFSSEDVLTGQEIWQSIGGQQVGSIWGHGALQAPDWTADWLHREAVATLAEMENEGDHNQVNELYISKVRANTYSNSTGEARIFKARAKAIEEVTKYYTELFTGELHAAASGKDLKKLRYLYALKQVTLHDKEKARKLCAFIFWSAWAAVTNRPSQTVTYTQNWPAERLVGNKPTPAIVFWSLVSVALLVAGIGALAWSKAGSVHTTFDAPSQDPLAGLVVTPSMRSMEKWAWTVMFLLGFQLCLGVYVAHVSVEGNMGIPDCITQHITYTVARTWHLQAAVFAIAASFLAAGLFLGPIIGGRTVDPPLQLAGANFLFICLLTIVVGSFAGNVKAVQQSFETLLMSQWFGTQGYEFVDLGRFWQYFLFIGLVLWLALMVNAVWPAVVKATTSGKERGEWHLVMMIVWAAVLIAAFYSAGFMFSARTNLAVMDYWRFWIVHMWVEGMFEVFITVVTAYIFVKLGVLESQDAARTSLITTGVFLFGGIPGMYHHNYFTGTPTMIVAVGACFSALEVVPLSLMGFEAQEYMAIQMAALKPNSAWLKKYKPILDCFVYVAFWNLVGAGFLGFLINPPISLYYMQGGYLTLSHSHGALWGVYGVLAIGLCLLVMRLSDLGTQWNTKWLDIGLKIMNVAMACQIFFSMFPIGLYQFWVAIQNDYWYARSENFHGDPTVQWLKLGRSVGDSLFGVGMLMVLYFVARVSYERITGTAQPLRESFLSK